MGHLLDPRPVRHILFILLQNSPHFFLKSSSCLDRPVRHIPLKLLFHIHASIWLESASFNPSPKTHWEITKWPYDRSTNWQVNQPNISQQSSRPVQCFTSCFCDATLRICPSAKQLPSSSNGLRRGIWRVKFSHSLLAHDKARKKIKRRDTGNGIWRVVRLPLSWPADQVADGQSNERPPLFICKQKLHLMKLFLDSQKRSGWLMNMEVQGHLYPCNQKKQPKQKAEPCYHHHAESLGKAGQMGPKMVRQQWTLAAAHIR